MKKDGLPVFTLFGVIAIIGASCLQEDGKERGTQQQGQAAPVQVEKAVNKFRNPDQHKHRTQQPHGLKKTQREGPRSQGREGGDAKGAAAFSHLDVPLAEPARRIKSPRGNGSSSDWRTSSTKSSTALRTGGSSSRSQKEEYEEKEHENKAAPRPGDPGHEGDTVDHAHASSHGKDGSEANNTSYHASATSDGGREPRRAKGAATGETSAREAASTSLFDSATEATDSHSSFSEEEITAEAASQVRSEEDDNSRKWRAANAAQRIRYWPLDMELASGDAAVADALSNEDTYDETAVNERPAAAGPLTEERVVSPAEIEQEETSHVNTNAEASCETEAVDSGVVWSRGAPSAMSKAEETTEPSKLRKDSLSPQYRQSQGWGFPIRAHRTFGSRYSRLTNTASTHEKGAERGKAGELSRRHMKHSRTTKIGPLTERALTDVFALHETDTEPPVMSGGSGSETDGRPLADWRDRLNTIRDRLDETIGGIPLVTVKELNDASTTLKEDFEGLLLQKKYGSRLKQVELQTESSAAGIQQLREAAAGLQARVQTWRESLRSLASRFNSAADVMHRERLEQYRPVAEAPMQQKYREFGHFLVTPRIDILCREYFLKQTLSDFATGDVSIVNAASWLHNLPGGPRPAEILFRSLLSKLRTAGDNDWNLEAVFAVIPPAGSSIKIDRTQLHLVPPVSTIRFVLQSLRRCKAPQRFAVVTVQELVIQSHILAFDSAGRIKPFKNQILKVPPAAAHSVVLASVEQYGHALRRTLLGASGKSLPLELPKSRKRNVKVLIAYLGERPVTRTATKALLKPPAIDFLKMAGASAVTFASILHAAAPEVQQFVNQVRQELRYFAAIERSCRQPIISANMRIGLRKLLRLAAPRIGQARIIQENNTAVLAAFSRVNLPSLPLSAFFRSSVALLQVDMGRSRFGRREYVVPPVQTFVHALSLLLSYPTEGEVVAKICTEVVRDTRFSSLRAKKGTATVFLFSGLRTAVEEAGQVSCRHAAETAVVAGTVRIADFTDRLQTQRSVVAIVTDQIAKTFLLQRFSQYVDKVESLVIYVQLKQH